ncbi:MAG TPA: OmpH family outer membrane protein, partial [Caulobacteraceae bacterium]|nr:OmpH family outer membrane protein [Caulobacteraceae bacterium]
LEQQVQAELQPEVTAIQTDARANDAARNTTDPAVMQTREANLQLRYTNYQRKAELRQRELQATAEKAQSRIAQELEPVLTQVYQQQHCSLLLRREAVLFGNPAMDVTPAAVTGLNARIQQFQFDREHLETQPAPAPAAH